jgi:cell division transport system ATP-binding protein
MSLLNISNVEFKYSNHPVFTDLNLQINRGEFAFLIGKSGAGKSTVLQLIYMNISPSSGTVEFDQYNSRTIKPKQLPYLRRKIGIVFQDFKLLKDRNVYDNLSFVLEATSTPGKEIKKRITTALSDVGLFHRRSSMPDQLSGGEKQRVAIARSILSEPMLVLADEPTGNLDPETSGEILDILNKIHQRGTAILFATHNYDIVKRVDAKIIKLENGKAFKAVLKQKT